MDVKLEQLESKTSTPGVTELMVGAALDQRGGGGKKKRTRKWRESLGRRVWSAYLVWPSVHVICACAAAQAEATSRRATGRSSIPSRQHRHLRGAFFVASRLGDSSIKSWSIRAGEKRRAEQSREEAHQAVCAIVGGQALPEARLCRS